MTDSASEKALKAAEEEYAAQQGTDATDNAGPGARQLPGERGETVEEAGPTRRPRRQARSAGAVRDAQTQEITDAALVRARKEGLRPEDEAAFRELVAARLTLGRSWLEEAAEIRGEYGPLALLQAVANLGGIGYNPNWDEAGEIAHFWGGQDKAKLKGASRSIRGIKRVFINGHDDGPDAFRKWGLRLDEMAKRLRQDPRFADIDGPDALVQALSKAANPNLDDAPGTLEDASDIRQENWWRADMGYAPAVEDAVTFERPIEDYSDDELRPYWETMRTLEPDASWQEMDVARWHAVMAEAQKRGWDKNAPPPSAEQRAVRRGSSRRTSGSGNAEA